MKFIKVLFLFIPLFLGCSKDSISPNGESITARVESMLSGETSTNYNPCAHLHFSGPLTEIQFTNIIQCLDKNGAISDVKDFLLEEPQYFVDMFNEVFQNKELRSNTISLLDTLKKEDALDTTLSFLSALLGAEVFESTFLGNEEEKSLAEYLIDDDIELSKTLSQIISSPYFSKLESVMADSINKSSFIPLAHSTSLFLSEAENLVELLDEVSQNNIELLHPHEIFKASQNHFGFNFISNLSFHTQNNPQILAPSTKLSSTDWIFNEDTWELEEETILDSFHGTEVYTPISSFFYKLLNSYTAKVSEDSKYKENDVSILLKLAEELNRPIKIEEAIEINILKSTPVFLANLLSFFNLHPDEDDIDDIELQKKIDRINRMVTYFSFADVLVHEMYDIDYQSLSNEDKFNNIFNAYKTRFNFDSIPRFESVFNSIQDRIKSFISTMPVNPVFHYLQEVTKRGDNLLLTLLPKAKALLTDANMVNALIKSLQDFLDFNKPIDDFLASYIEDEDTGELTTWLEETLDQLPYFATDIPEKDISLFISLIKSTHINIKMVRSEYFSDLPLALFGDLIGAIDNAKSLGLISTLSKRLNNLSTQNLGAVLRLFEKMITSHLLDHTLTFFSLQSKEPDFFDVLTYELFAPTEKRDFIKDLKKINPDIPYETLVFFEGLQKDLLVFQSDTEKEKVLEKLETLNLTTELINKFENLDADNQTRLITPLLDSFLNMTETDEKKTKLVSFLKAVAGFLENEGYLNQLTSTFKVYRGTSTKTLWKYFKSQKRLDTLFNIIAQTVKKGSIKKAAPFLKRIIDNKEIKNLFDTTMRVLELAKSK